MLSLLWALVGCSETTRVVREWLRAQSYEQQREFGLRILGRFGAIK